MASRIGVAMVGFVDAGASQLDRLNIWHMCLIAFLPGTCRDLCAMHPCFVVVCEVSGLYPHGAAGAFQLLARR